MTCHMDQLRIHLDNTTESKKKYSLTFERHLQLSSKQSAHFGHVVIITVDPVVHLFFAILPFAWAVWRRPSYVGHGRGQGGRPGLICGIGSKKKCN